MSDSTIALTENAARQIIHIISQENSSEAMRLRISVTGGGCSGFQYNFCLDENLTPDDKVFEQHHAQIVIDEMSLGLLSDSLVDYVEDLTSAQFVIKNPNATAGCGCGNSFSI
jgi:iron-sulfur cluster insertion protein